MKKIIFLIICITIIILSVIIILTHKSEIKRFIKNKISDKIDENVILDEIIEKKSKVDEEKKELASTSDINLYDSDGKGKNYLFTYKEEKYKAIYTKDNWHIIDSYKIKNKNDMIIICQALIDIHKIHGKDMKSYRTAEDMAYEWLQHNIAYEILPEENSWRKNAKDVDLDPEDQGKNIKEIYEARTGKNLTEEIIKKVKKKMK